MIRRSSTRSLTRSPTPIKYDYDIYKKRSPTFGRRCPVLNRRPRNTVKSETSNRSKSTITKPIDHSTVSPTTSKASRLDQQQQQQQQQQSITSSQSSVNGNGNSETSSKDNNRLRNEPDSIKTVSSRISSAIQTPGSSRGSNRPNTSYDNPSYFQHDDRQSQTAGGSGSGTSSGGSGGGKKVSRKRKPRQSPFRWQHDLFEDDRSPSEKPESRTNQRKKEAKISKNL